MLPKTSSGTQSPSIDEVETISKISYPNWDRNITLDGVGENSKKKKTKMYFQIMRIRISVLHGFSTNPIIGDGQEGDQFWLRVIENYNQF